MSIVFTSSKTPAARLDYTWDWTDWLAGVGDVLDTATVAVPDGLTAVGASVVDDGVVTQRISGGDVGATYELVCQMTTVGGLIDEKTIALTIVEH
jgi:hypothetical protein